MTELEDIDDEYELQVLFELRENEREEAERRYAQAMEQHEELSREVEKLQREHRQMIEKRKRTCRKFDEEIEEGGHTLEEIRRFDRYVSRLQDREEQMRDRVDQTRRKRRRAQKAVERAHDEMLEAIRQFQAVKAHYEDWQNDREVERRRKEAQKMDEIASRIWSEENR